MYYSDLITAAVGNYLLHDVCSYNCPKVLSSVRSFAHAVLQGKQLPLRVCSATENSYTLPGTLCQAFYR